MATEEKKKEVHVETTQAKESESIDNFSWDDGGGDFFGIEGSAVEELDFVNEVKGEKTEETIDTKDVKDTTKKEEVASIVEEEDDDFFGITKEESTSEETEEEEEEEDLFTKDKSKEVEYNQMAKQLKEKGILSLVEIPEEEIDEDKYFDLQDQEIEARVEEAIGGFFEELDEDGVNFLKFKKEGGNTADFFKTYREGSTVPKGDLDDEDFQETIARHYYSNVEELDSEDLEDKIVWLKESGKLEKYATKIDEKLKDRDKKSKEEILKKAAAQREANDKILKERKEAFIGGIKSALETSEQFTPKERKTLLPFITRATVKEGKNEYVTPLQSKLRTALKDEKKLLILAKMLMNDFDVSDMVAAKTTENTKRIKEDLTRSKKSGLKSSGKVNSRRRSLADHF